MTRQPHVWIVEVEGDSQWLETYRLARVADKRVRQLNRQARVEKLDRRAFASRSWIREELPADG